MDNKEQTQLQNSQTHPDHPYFIDGQYPQEDKYNEMFAPVWRRGGIWLGLIAFLLLLLIVVFFEPDVGKQAELDPKLLSIGLGIFACIAFLWLTEAMPLAATALLVPVLGTLLGVFNIQQALVSFAHPLIFIFFGGFALASALMYQGVDRWIAYRIMRLSRGKLLYAALFLFFITAFLSMWMSNTATTAMMIPLVLGILKQLDDSDGNQKQRTLIFFLLGIAYAASIGGMGSLVGSPPNGIAAEKLGISFNEWLSFGVPSVIALLPLMVIILVIMLKPKLKQEVKIESFEFKWTTPRLLTICIFISTALCWIFSKQISSLFGGIKYIDTVIALAAVFALLYTHTLRWRDVDHGTDWGVLILFGGGICLSSVLKLTGSSLYLASLFATLVEGWPVILVVAAVTLFVIFLTELSSNTATAALFVPIFYTVGLEMGLEPEKLVLVLALAASSAFMLPVATPPNAIVYGTGMIPQKSMMRVGIVLNLSFVGALTVLSNFLF